jgi:hypothetical protein
MNFKNIGAFLIATLFLTVVNNAQTIDTPYEVGTWQGFRSEPALCHDADIRSIRI